MTGIDLDAPEALDREKALTLAAVAARAWCGRASNDSSTGREVVRHLMLAASWASRARRHHALPPLGLPELVACLEQPVGEWLPRSGMFPLVEEGEPTSLCMDLADEAGASALAEVEQGVIKAVMNNLIGREDEAEAYTRFRRFLVEHAHATEGAASEATQEVGLALSRVYQRIAASSIVQVNGQDAFYPCPRCRWPMVVRGSLVSCHRSPTCLANGARFDLSEEGLVGLGRLSPPNAVAVDGMAALRPGVWRYTVLPGLEELDLAHRLQELPGTTVVLWPNVDDYDLDVVCGEYHWRVDVKDHSSAAGLARHLNEKPVRKQTWIVVPDVRRDQVPVLRRAVAEEANYRFASSSELVRRVRGVQ